MTSDELLRRYPRETLRWLRGQLRMSQEVFADHLDVTTQTVAAWETRRHAIAPDNRERIAPLLAPQLARPEGVAFAQALISVGAPHAQAELAPRDRAAAARTHVVAALVAEARVEAALDGAEQSARG